MGLSERGRRDGVGALGNTPIWTPPGTLLAGSGAASSWGLSAKTPHHGSGDMDHGLNRSNRVTACRTLRRVVSPQQSPTTPAVSPGQIRTRRALGHRRQTHSAPPTYAEGNVRTHLPCRVPTVDSTTRALTPPAGANPHSTMAHAGRKPHVRTRKTRRKPSAHLGRQRLDQTVKPRARNCSRPSSVILSGPHGGFHTQLILISLTSPAPTRAVRD